MVSSFNKTNKASKWSCLHKLIETTFKNLIYYSYSYL
jgi:hemerythrin superfamily protein